MKSQSFESMILDRLEALLKRQGLTPTEAGRMAGRANAWLNRKLDGSRSTMLADIDVTLDAIGCTVEDLLNE